MLDQVKKEVEGLGANGYWLTLVGKSVEANIEFEGIKSVERHSGFSRSPQMDSSADPRILFAET
jgi:hypothetical protein